MSEIRELKMGVFHNRTGGEGFLFCFLPKSWEWYMIENKSWSARLRSRLQSKA